MFDAPAVSDITQILQLAVKPFARTGAATFSPLPLRCDAFWWVGSAPRAQLIFALSDPENGCGHIIPRTHHPQFATAGCQIRSPT